MGLGGDEGLRARLSQKQVVMRAAGLLIKPHSCLFLESPAGLGPNVAADEPIPLARTIKTQLVERERGAVFLCRNARGWEKGQRGPNEAGRTEPEKVVPGSSKETRGGLLTGKDGGGWGDPALAWVRPWPCHQSHPPAGPPCELRGLGGWFLSGPRSRAAPPR